MLLLQMTTNKRRKKKKNQNSVIAMKGRCNWPVRFGGSNGGEAK